MSTAHQNHVNEIIRQAAAQLKQSPEPQTKEEGIAEALKQFVEKVSPRTDLDEKRVREIAKEEANNAGIQPAELKVQVNAQPMREVKGLRHVAFEPVLKRAIARIPIMLTGPAGCGKTHLAAQIAEALGFPFSFVSVSAGMSEGMLGGRLLPTGEGGKFEYNISTFVKAYEDGGVFLADEIDAGDANVMTFINSALANGHAAVPNRTDNPVAKKHENFVFMAAANTFGNGADRIYVGRNQLDGATLDRFRIGTVVMDYDDRLERQLAPSDIVIWGGKVRKQISEHGLRKIMSTRTMINAGKARAVGISDKEFKASYFADWKVDELSKIHAEDK